MESSEKSHPSLPTPACDNLWGSPRDGNYTCPRNEPSYLPVFHLLHVLSLSELQSAVSCVCEAYPQGAYLQDTQDANILSGSSWRSWHTQLLQRKSRGERDT